MTIRSGILAMAIVGAGCGDDSMGTAMSGTSAGGGSSAAGIKACNDVASAVDATCVRCGAMPGECSASFMSTRSCGQAVGVRDSDTLYRLCIPSVMRLTCEQLAANPVGALDASCQGQILFPR